MYAIISDSGRQYKVEEGSRVEVDYRELPVGGEITFDTVLAVSADGNLQVGTPVVAGATVVAEVIGEEKGPKLIVQKFRRRKNSRRKTGHRQKYTTVVVQKITTG